MILDLPAEHVPVDRLQDEGHDPSLGPLVRFILQDSHLTLGSMAAALVEIHENRLAHLRFCQDLVDLQILSNLETC